MEKFLNNKKMLITNHDDAFTHSNNFTITNLEKLSQVKIDNSTALKIAEFILRNSWVENYNSNQNTPILVECCIKELKMLKREITRLISRFEFEKYDIQLDDEINIKDNDTNSSIKMQINELYNELVTNYKIIKNKMTDEQKRYLFDILPIDEYEFLQISTYSSNKKCIFIYDGQIKYKIINDSYQRENYLKKMEENKNV